MLKVIMRSGKPRLQYRESQRTLACLAMRLPRVRQLMSFLLLYQKQTPAHIPKNLQEDRAQEMKTPQGTGNRLDSINQASPLVKAKQKERLAICDRSLQGTILQCTSRKRPVVLNLLQEEDNRIHLARDWAPQCPVQEQEKSIIGYISSTARGSTSNGKRHPNSIRMKWIDKDNNWWVKKIHHLGHNMGIKIRKLLAKWLKTTKRHMELSSLLKSI